MNKKKLHIMSKLATEIIVRLFFLLLQTVKENIEYYNNKKSSNIIQIKSLKICCPQKRDVSVAIAPLAP